MTETAKLTSSDGVASDQFGFSVAVSGSTVVIGANDAGINGAAGESYSQGAAYVFNQPAAGWGNTTETSKITSADGQAYDNFGSAVAADSGTVLVGAQAATGGGGTGLAYVFGTPVITVTSPGNQSADPAQSQTFALGTFTQSGAPGPFTVNVNWGDGSADSIFADAATGTIPATTHTYASVGNDTVTVTVSNASNVTGSATFGVTVAVPSIAGTVYSDTKDTGVYNPADPGLSDVMVYLDSNNNGKLDAGEISVTTNASGNYLIPNVAPGNYTLREYAPGGYVQTFPIDGFINVTVAAGQTITGQTFLDAPSSNATAEAVYRLYSPVTLEHLYTTDPNEYNVLQSYTGTWNGEGEVFSEYSGNATVGGVKDEPLYRLYDAPLKQHFWTDSYNEYNTLRNAPWDWNDEGIVGYVFPTAVAGSEPLYRMMAPQVHLWTTDVNEYDTLTSEGWTQEGVIGYVL